MSFYSKIIKKLCKPHIELFKEALHEELIYVKNPNEYNSNQMKDSLKKINDKLNEKNDYPILILDTKGNYRIYTDENSYITFDDRPGSKDSLKNVLKSLNKNRIGITVGFDEFTPYL